MGNKGNILHFQLSYISCYQKNVFFPVNKSFQTVKRSKKQKYKTYQKRWIGRSTNYIEVWKHKVVIVFSYSEGLVDNFWGTVAPLQTTWFVFSYIQRWDLLTTSGAPQLLYRQLGPFSVIFNVGTS